MPELPEVHALTNALRGHLAGRTVERSELASFAALKTFDPPLEALAGRKVDDVTRRGKFVAVEAEGLFLVVHFARGGWLHWYDLVPKARAKPGRGPLALRLRLDDGAGFDITEMGTEKRLALWVVPDLEQVPPLASLGTDPLTEDFTVARLAEILSEAGNTTVKTVLTTQSLIAGVGNAYSDEALHRARFSPYRRADRLDPEEVARLHDATVAVLTEAVERLDGLPIGDLKADKKRSMRVHGRTGEACPECGDTVREVSFATKSLQYCPTCQTGGKALADRRLSRLLK
ncbi:MAG: Fpg/Nei family DNA glycosylase [Acidimicrobiales bacterium]|nr:Fpg/Nei family DNA glycosylase [Acidimicrobiales bacterium]